MGQKTKDGDGGGGGVMFVVVGEGWVVQLHMLLAGYSPPGLGKRGCLFLFFCFLFWNSTHSTGHAWLNLH